LKNPEPLESHALPRVCKKLCQDSKNPNVVQDWRPDVLISDIEIPGEDGYALIQEGAQPRRRGGGKVPAVALTAYGKAEDRRRSMSAGFSMHVPKPVDPTELVTIVANLAGR
jgi:CheY-like chemotaxis protein